ncbi:MAG: hypothetical protein GY867_11355 [bacterium]|nr:hypothetical protein [bacterium]
MSRSPRFLPKNQDGVLVEVSCRTVNAWALLRPSAELSDVTVGVLGRSLEISPVELVAVSFMSNHWHGLLVAEDQQQLSRFMQHFQGNLAREVGRIVGWKGPMSIDKRYRDIHGNCTNFKEGYKNLKGYCFFRRTRVKVSSREARLSTYT